MLIGALILVASSSKFLVETLKENAAMKTLILTIALLAALAAPSFSKPTATEVMSSLSKARNEVSKTLARNTRG
jgi:hypothetical protein